MASTFNHGWYYVTALASIMIAAAALRFWRLDEPELTFTEAFSWKVASSPLDELLRSAGRDTHPPGHFLLLKVWMSVFGDSVVALRSLSAACGVLCVTLMYSLVIEAVAFIPGHRNGTIDGPRDGAGSVVSGNTARIVALFASVLVTAHSWQIEAARTARMYSMGALFALLSTWLLLRAVRATPNRLSLWSLYGLSVAAFVYTHYFALFTVGAQVVWALFETALRGRCSLGTARRQTLDGVILGTGIAGLLFSPWLPVWLAQARRVQHDFWISMVGANDIAALVAASATGTYLALPIGGPLTIFALAVIAGLLWLSAVGGPAGRLLALSASLPWLLSWGVSTLGGRPLILDRYLTFANVIWVACLGLALARVNQGPLRAAFALLCAVPAIDGASCELRALTRGPGPYGQAVAWVGDNARTDDVVVTSGPGELCLVRYYAAQTGTRVAALYCVADDGLGVGQSSDVAVLRPSDLLKRTTEPLSNIQRIWSFSNVLPEFASYDAAETREFLDAQHQSCRVTLWTRRAGASQTSPARGDDSRGEHDD